MPMSTSDPPPELVEPPLLRTDPRAPRHVDDLDRPGHARAPAARLEEGLEVQPVRDAERLAFLHAAIISSHSRADTAMGFSQ
jgi:hypothetical protein